VSRFNIQPRAPYGSLLKGAKPEPSRKAKPAKAKHKPARSAREHDNKHLAAVRLCPCVSCDNDPAREAAHVSMSRAGKPIKGVGNKADDRWTLPLCHGCHVGNVDAQHNVGEAKFWSGLGIDPLALCAELHAVSPDVPKMRAVIFKARENRR
jgi:hypothetical protein